MQKNKLDRAYISEDDKLLYQLHEKAKLTSRAIQREIEKHQKIAQMRDNPNVTQAEDIL